MVFALLTYLLSLVLSSIIKTILHFDSAINHGVGRAKKFLEQSGGDFDKYYQARKTFYDDIVRGDKTQAEFYQGWMNRINRIDKMRYQN